MDASHRAVAHYASIRQVPCRKPRKNTWISEAQSNFVAVDTRRMSKLRGVQTMGCPTKSTLQLRKDDPLKVKDNLFVLKKQPNP